MTSVVFVNADGSEHTIDVENGMSLMQAAIKNNVKGIVGECSGSMMCATCHVYVEDPRVDEKCESESEMLEMVTSEPRDSSRLSCQIKVSEELDGLVVQIPSKQI